MRITILQENLLKAMNRASRIIGSKPQMPILQHVLITVSDTGDISITGTNMETTLQQKILGKVEESGSICIPARLLTELVSSLPKDSVRLSTDQETLHIVGGRTKATIPGVSASEFPPIVSVNTNIGVDLLKKELITALQYVVFSAATDEARPLLMGIRLEPTDAGTAFVATDGYRLSMKTIPTSEVSGEPLVIPARALTEVLRIAQEEKDGDSLRLTESIEGQLSFVIGDTQIITRRIEGEYPTYRKIIPTTSSTKITMETEELSKAVKSASIFARDSAGIIKLQITDTTVTVSANTPQVGENTIEIDAEGEGEGGVLALNSRFLMDLLSTVSTPTLSLAMTGALNPAVFTIPEDESFLHIIMPVRVQN